MGKKRAHGKRGGTREAMQRLAAAYAEVSAARAALAKASVVGQEPARAQAAYRLLDAHKQLLLRTPGVVGVGLGIGPKREPRLAVFVEKVDDSAKLLATRIDPLTLLRDLPIGIDVVRFGNLRLPPIAEQFGADAHFKTSATATLSPGDGIGPQSASSLGTLGAFALNASDEPVAITAMHVVPNTSSVAQPIPVVCRTATTDPGQRIGQIDRGTRTSVDAARIQLAPGVEPVWTIPELGRVAGWRWACSADVGAAVSVYGAMSGRVDGRIEQVNVDFSLAGGVTFHDAIVVSIRTDFGDSGAALLDSDNYVLGFLAGMTDQLPSSMRIFSLAGLVLDHLDCNIP
jgi:hypothetical protein